MKILKHSIIEFDLCQRILKAYEIFFHNHILHLNLFRSYFIFCEEIQNQ